MSGIVPWLSLLALCSACGVTSDDAPRPQAQPTFLRATLVDLDQLALDVPAPVPFGARMENDKISPAIEYFAPLATAVRAPCDGTVERVLHNEGQGDEEIHIAPADGPGWLVVVDHVVSLEVAAGDRVAAGTRLGAIGGWSDRDGRTELQVNRLATGLAHCPLELCDPGFRAEHERFVARWLARTGRRLRLCVRRTVVP